MGKTSIFVRLTKGNYAPTVDPTLQMDIGRRIMRVAASKTGDNGQDPSTSELEFDCRDQNGRINGTLSRQTLLT